MRVQLHCEMFGPPWNEGAKNIMRAVGAGLRERGHQVVHTARRLTGEALNAHAVGTGRLSSYVAAGVVGRAHRVDVVHTLESNNPLTGLRCRALARFSGAPVLCHVTGLGGRPRRYESMPGARGVAIGSPFLERYHPGADYIPGLPSLPDLTPLPPCEKPVVGFLGAMEPERGVDTVFDAMSHLGALGVPATLRMAWNGAGTTAYYEKMMAYAEGQGLSVVVERDVDARAFYESCRVIVIPRREERRMSLPLRVMECALLERPIAVSKILDLPRLVGDMGVGFEVDDGQSLAEAIAPILDPSSGHYERAVAACRSRRSEFEPEHTLDRLIDVYERICS
jgi:hypothetical protein